jgi:hypothetical protein
MGEVHRISGRSRADVEYGAEVHAVIFLIGISEGRSSGITQNSLAVFQM